MTTIFALSTGPGRTGVAVWRLSGPKAVEIARAFSRRELPPRKAVLSKLTDPTDGTLIDEGLVLTFPAPTSFTGEEMAEFQLHGSLAVADKLQEALLKAGALPAEAGEFTARAFRNGKMDLAQAEAVADLIEAETSRQLQQAQAQYEGRLSDRAEDWRRALLGAMAPLEAAIDFPDEEDVPETIARQARPIIERLRSELTAHLEEATAARRVRQGIVVVLTGPPNAGKSSLLNWLAESEIAIVSDIPGTTRDLLEARIILDGLPVTLVDTAGLRELPEDGIEAEGIRRAKERAASADMRLVLVDGATPTPESAGASTLKDGDLLVLTKADLSDQDGSTDQPEAALRISVKTGEGLDKLLSRLKIRIHELSRVEKSAGLTRLRHRQAVENAVGELDRALTILDHQPELAAESVRLAARSLGRITGAVDVEEVLGEIFSSFCIGK